MNDTEKIKRILEYVIELTKGRSAQDGMINLLCVLECLLLAHKRLVEAFPNDAGAECKQQLLNIIMLHVLSPYKDVAETKASMGKFAVMHRVVFDFNTEVCENAEN